MTEYLEASDGIDGIVAKELGAVRDAVTAVENGVSQDAADNLDGWREAFVAASNLTDAADALTGVLRRQVGKREDES